VWGRDETDRKEKRGFKEPDDVSIQAAIALNDKFIDDLQAIHQRAQALTID